MGDMADYTLDQMFDDERDDQGEPMGSEVGYVGYFPQQAKPIRCRYCGKPDLHWGYHEGRSRLFDDAGTLHVCKEYLLRRPVQ